VPDDRSDEWLGRNSGARDEIARLISAAVSGAFDAAYCV
jgi:hypothetical protein